jgi:glutamyl-tRNA synthetase
VVDDAAMGVTQVLRGQDLLPSTARQILLYRLLGLEVPRFAHAPLVRAAGEDGEPARLSKRDRSLSLSTLRSRGADPRRVVGLLAALSGLVGPTPSGPPACTPAALVPMFVLGKVPAGAVLISGSPELA